MTPPEFREARSLAGLTLGTLPGALARLGWAVSPSTVRGWSVRGAPDYVRALLVLMALAPEAWGSCPHRRGQDAARETGAREEAVERVEGEAANHTDA